MGFPVISSKIKTRPRLPKAKGFFENSNYFLATYYAENSNENNSVLTDDRLPSSNFKGLRRGVGREIFTIVFSPIVFGLLLSPRKKKKMKIPGGIPGGHGYKSNWTMHYWPVYSLQRHTIRGIAGLLVTSRQPYWWSEKKSVSIPWELNSFFM